MHLGSPPLARGTVDYALPFFFCFGITPACAGNSGVVVYRVQHGRDHPRLRGEQAARHLFHVFGKGSPPLARGTDLGYVFAVARKGITPACAGNRRRLSDCPCPPWDHPRLRGEQNPLWPFFNAHKGSPPLARGTGNAVNPYQFFPRITPACAGNSCEAQAYCASRWDHPRLRGEQPRQRKNHP